MRGTLWKTGIVAILSMAVAVGAIGGVGDAALTDVYQRVTFVEPGAKIECTKAGCAIPLVVPELFAFSSVGSPYDVVITVTVTFRTSPRTRISLGPIIHGSAGDTLVGISDGRPLGGATRARSVSLSWLVEGLAAGETYDYEVWFGPTSIPDAPTYFVEASSIVSVIEATPA